jgi:hypothetical protein
MRIIVYILVVRETNEYVNVYLNDPTEALTDKKYYRVLKEQVVDCLIQS